MFILVVNPAVLQEVRLRFTQMPFLAVPGFQQQVLDGGLGLLAVTDCQLQGAWLNFSPSGSIPIHDVEMDSASVAHGKLDARVQLPGGGQEEMKVSMVRTDPFRTDPFLTFPFLKAEAQWRAWLRVERLLGEWWIGEDSAAGLARRSPLID